MSKNGAETNRWELRIFKDIFTWPSVGTVKKATVFGVSTVGIGERQLLKRETVSRLFP
jgi:hypothetical protein